jgi:hypothetical protein
MAVDFAIAFYLLKPKSSKNDAEVDEQDSKTRFEIEQNLQELRKMQALEMQRRRMMELNAQQLAAQKSKGDKDRDGGGDEEQEDEDEEKSQKSPFLTKDEVAKNEKKDKKKSKKKETSSDSSSSKSSSKSSEKKKPTKKDKKESKDKKSEDTDTQLPVYMGK